MWKTIIARFLLLLVFVAAFGLGVTRSSASPHAVVTIIASKTDALLIDADGSGGATPGDTIEYTVTIQSFGDEDALGAAFDDPISDPNLTIVDLPGSDFRSTPIARNDIYDSIGNVGITVPAGSGVLVNDNDPDGTGGVTIVAFDAVSDFGGNVVVNLDGSFTYAPPVGYVGIDYFEYTVEDVDGNTDPATVAIDITGMIWFIDNSAGAAGDGRLNSPFNTLAAFEAVNGNGGATDPAAGEAIFVHTGSGADYTGGVTLENAQLLVGQGATATLETITGLVLPPFSNPLPATSGTRPVIADAAGNAITLAQNNLVRGLNTGNTGNNVDIVGTNVGTLTILEVSALGTGGGIDIDNGTLAVALDTVDATSTGSPGIELSNVTGNFATTTGTLNQTNREAVNISGNVALNVTLASITASGATNNVRINQTTGTFTVLGTSTLSGATGNNILLSSTNSTITFGVVNINSRQTTGILMDAVSNTINFGVTTIPNPSNAGGYGIRVQNSNAAVTLAATNISNTNQTVATTDAGADAIPDNDGDGDAIFLTNNTGSFTSNGGTIQNVDDGGVDLRGTGAVGTTYLTLNGVTIQDIGVGSGNPATVHPAGVFGINLRGTNRILNSTITRFQTLSGSRGVSVLNVGVSFDTLEIRNTAISNTSGVIAGDDGVLVVARGAVNGTVTVADDFAVGNPSHRSTFQGLSGEGVQVLNGQSGGSGTLTVNVTNVNFVSAVNPAGFGGVDFGVNGTATLLLNVTGSTFDNLYNINALGFGIVSTAVFGDSNYTGNITSNNVSGNATPANDGRRGVMQITGDLVGEEVVTFNLNVNNNTMNDTEHEAVYIDVMGDALTTSGNPARVNINNNAIGQTIPVSQSGREGVEIRVRDIGGGGAGPKTFNLLMENNLIRNADDSSGDETIDIDSENDDGTRINATVRNNTFTSNGFASDEFEIESFTGGLADINCFDYIGNIHTGGGPGSYRLTQAGGFFNAVNFPGMAGANTGTLNSTGTITNIAGPCALPLIAETLPTTSHTPVPAIDSVDAQLVAEAQSQWAALDLADGQLARLDGVTIEVTDLPDGYLGEAEGNTIRIDRDAAGHGWYVDNTPTDATEFSLVISTTEWQATETSPAYERMDLLSVIMHEMGHIIGHSHDDDHAHALMTETLPVSTRRSPAAVMAYFEMLDGYSFRLGQEMAAAPANLEPLAKAAPADVSYDQKPEARPSQFTANLGLLNPTQQVIITYQVTINNPLVGGPSQVCNQGTVSGSNFASVLTDDPDVGGGADPTCMDLQVIDLRVEKTDNVDPVIAGSGAGNLVHVVTVTNDGPADATGVELSEVLTVPAGVTIDTVVGSGTTTVSGTAPNYTWTVGNLLNGASETLTITMTVDETAVDGSIVSDTATVTTATQTIVNPANDTFTEDTTIAREIDLTVSKTESIDPVIAGSGVGNLTYIVTVTNNGPSDATGVELSEVLSLPADTTVDSVTPSGTTAVSGASPNYTWTVGALPVGNSETLTVVLTVGSGASGFVSDTATVTAANETLINTGDDSATEDTTVGREVDLEVQKTESIDPAVAGAGVGNLVYTITVTNNGPSDASGVALSEVLTLPAGVTVDSVVGSGSTTVGGASPNYTWTVGALPNGATETLTVTLTVATGATTGTDVIDDTATVTAVNETDTNAGNDSAFEATSVIDGVDLVVTKTESIDPVVAGSGVGNLTYVVTVTNNGPLDATGVELSEVLTLPAGVGVDSITGSGTTSVTGASPNYTWLVGGLLNGASETLTVVLTADITTLPGVDVISDTATVTTLNEPLYNPGDDSATESTSVVRQTDLTVSKTESIDPVLAGSGIGNLTYVVTVTNNGPADASAVELSEVLTLPAGVTVDSVTPSGTTTVAGAAPNYTWTVGNLANAASETLTVTLTVDGTTAAGVDVISDTATITNANEILLNPGDDSATESTSVVRQVDLVVSKTESIDPVIAGSGVGNLTYVVTVTNNGPADATGVELSEVLTLPAGVTVDSVTPSGTTTVGGVAPNYTWTVGNLANGASEILTVVLTVSSATASGTDVISDTATVTAANETLVNTGDDSATESTSVSREVDLVVTKVESADPVVAGSGVGNLTYTITVANNGPSDATGVELSEVLTLPAGVTVDSVTPSGSTSVSGASPNYTWTVGNLANGASETLIVVLTVGPTAPLGTDIISDTATVTAVNETAINTGDDSATESTSISRQTDLMVTKVESADPVLAGSGVGNLTYIVTVTNNGPSDATGVELGEVLTLPTGVTVDSVTPSGSGSVSGAAPFFTWTVGNLANGASETLTVILTVGPSAPAGVDVISDTASISAANEALINPGDDSATESTSVVREVDLTVTKVESIDPVLAGSGAGNLTYTITVTNNGPSDASGVVLSEVLTLPAGVTVDSATGSGTTVVGGAAPNYTWTVGTLADGASETLTVVLTVSSATAPGVDVISDTATLTAVNEPIVNTGDDSATESTSVVREVDLTVTKVESIDPVVAGSGVGNLTYTITVTNNGPSDASGVELSEVLTLPAGVTVDSATGSGTTTVGGASPNYTWTVGTLANGASETLTVILTVDATAASGTDVISDTATVTAVNEPIVNTGDDSATESTSIGREIDLNVVKVESIDPVAAGSGAGNLTYTITVTNNGPSDATGVELSEDLTLPTGVTVDSVTPSGTGSVSGTSPNFTWTVGDLANGASETLMVVLTVDATAPSGIDSISDTATVTAANENLVNTGDDSDTESTSVLSVPDLSTATKIVDDATFGNNDGLAQPGEVLLYTIVVTNTGDQTSTNVVVEDTPSVDTALNVGSVTTTQGTIVLGNNGGDTTVQVDLGDLTGGSSATITFEVTVNDPIAAGVTLISNIAQVTADGIPTFDTPPADIPVDAAVDVAATKSDALAVDGNGNSIADAGDTLEYTVIITNSGDQDDANVIFSDTPDANTSLVVGSVVTSQGTVTTGNTAGDTDVVVDIGTLAGQGGSVTITFQVTINSPIPDGVVQVVNQGVVNSDTQTDLPTDDPDVPGSTDPTSTPLGTIGTEPQLGAYKVDSLLVDADANTVPSAGDTLEYTVTLLNIGVVDVTTVVFTDTPGLNTTLVVGSVTTTQGTIVLGNTGGDTSVQVDVGDIPSSFGVAITFQVTIDNPTVPPDVTSIENQGQITADSITSQNTDDPDTPAVDDPTVTPLGSNPLLLAYKTDALTDDVNGDGDANPEDTLTYTVTILNNGNADATNVDFSDSPDTNTTLVSGSVTTSQGTVTDGNGAGDTTVGVNIPTLAVGDSVTITFEVTINAGLTTDITEVSNQGTVIDATLVSLPTDDPDTPTLDDPTVTPIVVPSSGGEPGVSDPALSKIGILAPGELGLPGEQITWVITATNPNGFPLDNVVITDTLVPELQIDDATTQQGTVTINGQTVTFQLGTLQPGQTVEMRIVTTVLDNPASGVITNTATLTSGGFAVTATASVPVPTGLPDTGYPPVNRE
ncbi:MAG: DUF11 domain-containing protein [Anaerolineales bacterium]|nr:DUF11 domain-containing protein [Anaerolineales bacterium]